MRAGPRAPWPPPRSPPPARGRPRRAAGTTPSRRCARPIGVCRLKPRPAKRRSLVSASHSARSASVGLRRSSRARPRTGARSFGHAAPRRARRAACAASPPRSPSSTPPRAGPLRPSAIAMMTPCRVWMSCRVGSMRWKMLRRLISMVSRLSAGRKIFDLLQLALEIGEEGEQLLACRRRRLLRHRERQCAAGRELAPLVGDDQHRLRQIERGEGRIDRQRDDAVGERDLVVLEPVALAPEHHADGLAGRDLRRHQLRRLLRRHHRLGLVVRPRRGGEHEGQVGDRRLDACRTARPRRARGRRRRPRPRRAVGPAVARLDQPQPRQAEIRHGARRRADIVAELRLDQDHHRRRRLDPALGLVGAGAGHAVLLGGQMP